MKMQYIDTTEESLKEDEYHRSLEARYDNDDIDCIEETMRTETTDLLNGLDESNIVRGKEFKNYKEMCIELNIGYKGGDTKRKQLKELEVYYFLYKQDGRKFKITKVHNLTDIEKRVRTLKSNYKDYIEELIVDSVLQDIENRKTLDYTESELFDGLTVGYLQLAKMIGIVNKNYTDCMTNERIYSYISEYKEETINDWKISFHAFLRRLIKNTVQNLEDKNVITCEEKYFVCEHNRATRNNKDDRKFLNTRLANSDERQTILKIKQEYLDSFQVGSTREIFKKYGSRGFKQYKDAVRNCVTKELKIQSYFLSYNLKLNEYAIERYNNMEIFNLKLTNGERNKYISQMSKMVMQKINANAKTRHIQAREAIEINNKSIKNIDEMRASDDYIKTCENITKDVISRNQRKDYSKIIQENKLELYSTEKRRCDFIDYLYGHLVFNRADSIISTIDGTSGIYAIHNLRNNKRYVGSTRNFAQRLKEHKSFLENGVHHSYKLQNDFDAYYESDFRFEILEVVDKDIEDNALLKLEQKYMDILDVFTWGYNIRQIKC